MALDWLDRLPIQQCVDAFSFGEKLKAQQLLPATCAQPSVVRTSFGFLSERFYVGMVSLLHLAAYHGWRDMVILLVEVHGCSVHSRDEQGHTPLHYAAYKCHFEVMKYFITVHHCNPMEKSNNGTTLVHFACMDKSPNDDCLKIVQYLISEAHCDPSCENDSGWTPLLYACCSGNGKFDVVQYLVHEARCNIIVDNENFMIARLCFGDHIQYLETHCKIIKSSSSPLSSSSSTTQT